MGLIKLLLNEMILQLSIIPYNLNTNYSYER